MLKFLRKNTKIVIWTVVISFVLWGGYSVGTQFQKKGRIAGEVFGKDVTFQEFDTFYRASQIFTVTGKPTEDPEMLKQHAWQSIILSREAKRQKIEVTDDDVLAEVFRLLALQNIENPTPEVYRRWLKATIRETPQEFESQIREILRIQKLIRQVNTQPIEPPSDEQVYRDFLRDYHMLTAELMLFPTLEEAKAFHEKVPTPQKWNDETKDKSEQVRSLTKISLDSLIDLWQVSEETAFDLHKMDPESISEPIPVSNKVGVFYLISKVAADEEKFESELKEEYVNRVVSQKKYERYVEWATEIRERANLRDYLPRPEPVASTEPSSENSS